VCNARAQDEICRRLRTYFVLCLVYCALYLVVKMGKKEISSFVACGVFIDVFDLKKIK
jgi:hypothetical protein